MSDYDKMYDGMNLTAEEKDAMDTFAATLGLGPKYTPTPTKKHECPSCKKKNAYYKEIHPDCDGGMNEIVLSCPDCGYDFLDELG